MCNAFHCFATDEASTYGQQLRESIETFVPLWIVMKMFRFSLTAIFAVIGIFGVQNRNMLDYMTSGMGIWRVRAPVEVRLGIEIVRGPRRVD